MPTESFELVTVLPATPEQIYEAWLDSQAHAAFTGSGAAIDPGVGGRFTAWDGYIEGTNLELSPGVRILQAWRTTEFPSSDADSRLELVLEREGDGTRVTLRHSEIPEGQGGQYHSGWQDHYFTPMLAYFSRSAPAKPAARKVAVRPAAPKRKPVAKKKSPAKKAAGRKPVRKAPAKKPAARRKKK